MYLKRQDIERFKTVEAHNEELKKTILYNINMYYDEEAFEGLLNHTYTYEDDEVKRKVPSVTQVLNVVDKPKLTEWIKNMAFKHIDSNVIKERAALYGTIVHKAIEEYFVQNTKISNNPSFNKFLDWHKAKGGHKAIKLLAHEEQLITPYAAGTFDAIMEINGAIWLVDYKTSNQISPEYLVQLSTYYYLLKETKFLDKINLTPDNIEGLKILHISKSPYKGYHEYNIMDKMKIAEYYGCFLSYLSSWWYRFMVDKSLHGGYNTSNN